MRISTQLLIFLLGMTLTATVGARQKPKAKQLPPHKDAVDYTRLQIFLDNANFGPGKIDGHDGDFTKKALALYRIAQGQPAAGPVHVKAPIDVSGIDLSSVDPVFIEYEVTKEDIASVGALPKGPAAQAKVKRLPYATLAEGIAEKFHTDLDYLKKLNAGKTDHIKVGDKLKVPNVKPFELTEVKTLEPGSEAAAVIANELGETVPSPSSTPDSASATPNLEIHVSIKENMLELRVGDKVAAAFPVTVGSHQTVSPVGKWTVTRIAKMPNFRYDLSMLNKGKRSSNFHLLPPGPNNPVGVIWIALNKKGIGIHGTSEPDTIGRASSHGCIRLANWDAVKVAELVKPGAKVTIE